MFIAGLALTLTAVAATARLVRAWRRSRLRRGVDRARAEAAERTNERQARARTEAAFLEAHQAEARRVRSELVEVETGRTVTGSTLARPLNGRQLLEGDLAHLAAVGELVYDPAVWE